MPLNLVPNANQTLNATQAPILNNFTTIGTDFNVDHVDYGIMDAGKHKKVTLPIQGSAPSFSAGEDGFFNLVSALTNIPETHIVKQNFSASSPGYTSGGAIPMTASTLSTVANPTSSQIAPFFTYLPSGMIIAFGTNSGTGVVTITASTTGLSFNQILWANACMSGNNTAGVMVRPQSVPSGVNSFTVNVLDTSGNPATGTFAWICIGY